MSKGHFVAIRSAIAGLPAFGLMTAGLLAAAPAGAEELYSLLADGGEVYINDRVVLRDLSDRWVLAPDGGLSGMRTEEYTDPTGTTIVRHIPLAGEWYIEDGDLCFESNLPELLCYTVTPGGGGGTADRYTGVEIASGRTVPVFIYPGEED